MLLSWMNFSSPNITRYALGETAAGLSRGCIESSTGKDSSAGRRVREAQSSAQRLSQHMQGQERAPHPRRAQLGFPRAEKALVGQRARLLHRGARDQLA